VAQNAHIWMANVGTSIKPAFVQNGSSARLLLELPDHSV